MVCKPPCHSPGKQHGAAVVGHLCTRHDLEGLDGLYNRIKAIAVCRLLAEAVLAYSLADHLHACLTQVTYQCTRHVIMQGCLGTCTMKVSCSRQPGDMVPAGLSASLLG